MKFKYILLFAILSSIMSPTLTANSYAVKKASIMGIVIDSKTEQPIEYATLAVYNETDSTLVTGTISGAEGEFIISNLIKGSYYMEIKFIGYETKTISKVMISSNNQQIDLGTISISPASINLQETEVVGTNNYIDFKIDKKIINVQEQISAEGSAVVDALINVPSIQVDGAGNVSLRGSTSFTLLIDGQPTVLTASDALNQIQSASVDKIEIITNPGVKYDSDGTSGIINLIMKKQKRKGTSEQVTLALATGDKYTASVLVNKRKTNLSSHLGATYSNRRKRTNSTDNREYYNGDSIDFQGISSDRDIYRKTYKFNGGLGWDINENHHLKFDAELGFWEFSRSISSEIKLNNSYNDVNEDYNSYDDFTITNKYATGNLGYSYKFNNDGHKLDIAVYYSQLNNNTPNNIITNQLAIDGEVENSEYLALKGESDRNHLRTKADYSLPVSEKLNLDIGYQNDIKKSNSSYVYKYRNGPAHDWIISNVFSGESDFNRNINSIYGSAGFDISSLSVQAGIKLEFVNRSTEDLTNQKDYNYDKVNLFPSLHLSRELGEDKQLSLSYSRRVNRPNEWMLIPAAVSTGRYMLQIGNPELIPGFTNSYELSFSLRNDKTMLSSTLYAMQTSDAITTATSEKDGVFNQTYENIDNELSAGLELMTNLNLKKWWKINLSANAYYYELNGNLKSGLEIDNHSFNWNGSFRTTFIVKKKTYLEFLAIYYGPSILPQGNTQDFYYFDFFIKRNFLKRRLSIALRSHNTFDTGIYSEDISGVNYKAHTWFKYEGPTFMLTLTYRFNNFRRHRAVNQPDMNFDSGLDH
jgi:outer membrane receptor protein involved in Fe transport